MQAKIKKLSNGYITKVLRKLHKSKRRPALTTTTTMTEEGVRKHRRDEF